MKNGLRTLVLALALTALMAMPATAQNPTADTYGGVLGEQVSGGDGGGDTSPASQEDVSTTTAAADGSLPFTGLEVGFVVLLGAVLIGTGLVIRATSRGRAQQ